MHQLVLKVYTYTNHFPKEELYGLKSDMRRAVRSAPINFVEGYRRKGYKDAMNFFNRSSASLEELQYQIFLSLELDYLSVEQYDELFKMLAEVTKMLSGWQKSYRPKPSQTSHYALRTSLHL